MNKVPEVTMPHATPITSTVHRRRMPEMLNTSLLDATEGSAGRALTGSQESTLNMTAEACIVFCGGSIYIGVEYFSECYCGPSKPASFHTLESCWHSIQAWMLDRCPLPQLTALWLVAEIAGRSVADQTVSTVSLNRPSTSYDWIILTSMQFSNTLKLCIC